MTAPTTRSAPSAESGTAPVAAARALAPPLPVASPVAASLVPSAPLLSGALVPAAAGGVELAAAPAVSASRARRSLREISHGPEGRLPRLLFSGLLATALVAGCALIFRLADLIHPAATTALALTALAWWAVAVAAGVGWADGPCMRPARPVLVAGNAVVVGLAVLTGFGAPVPQLRELLEFLLVTTVLALALRTLLAWLYRPRVVLLSPWTQIPGRAESRARSVIRISEETLPQELVAQTVTAVDSVQADVVHVSGHIDEQTLTHLSWELRHRGVPLEVDLLEGALGHTRIQPVVGSDGASVLIAPPLQSPVARCGKRIIDVLGSLTLLILLSPVLAVTAVLIARQDGFPVLFRQERVGKDGRPFRILKFRTMQHGAEARLGELMQEQGRGEDPLFKVKDDPRVTPLGAFLRRSSIDELPQLLNVLAGSMSLVGPRPQCRKEVDLYTGTAAHRLGVTPGMTGLWQVSGRSRMTWEEARRLDVHYAHNWSLLLDLRILVRTVRAVLARDGAE